MECRATPYPTRCNDCWAGTDRRLPTKLQRWLQSGGHAEPVDQGLMHLAALREARAETGCEVRLHEAAPSLIDVDIHPIPGN